MIKVIISLIPEIIRMMFFVFVSPFYNIYLCLKCCCIIHPLAKISPRVRIGRDTVIGKSIIRTYYGGRITIGSNCTVHNNCELYAHRKTKIEIGNDCMLAKRTIIMTRNHIFDDPNLKMVQQGVKDENVEIGSDVWTGLDAKILPGVKIGDGCVIGTSAVVTKDLEPMSVAVGIPAKVIKKRGE